MVLPIWLLVSYVAGAWAEEKNEGNTEVRELRQLVDQLNKRIEVLEQREHEKKVSKK